jgi:hypothetical protein
MPWNIHNLLKPSLAAPLDTSNDCELARKHLTHLPRATINESLHQKRQEEIISPIGTMYLPHLLRISNINWVPTFTQICQKTRLKFHNDHSWFHCHELSHAQR